MNFQNLDEYYDYLESDHDFKYIDFNSYKYIAALRDKTDDEELKKICSYELFFSDFTIEKGIHIPKFQSGASAYPTLELFDDNFDYIKVRANNVVNPKYKAKYNHLLWLSPQKHIDFAKQAIDNYLVLLETSSFSVEDNLQCLSFSKYFKNLFVIANRKLQKRRSCAILHFAFRI